MQTDNKTPYLLTLFPNKKDHEEILHNGFLLMKSRHGTTGKLQVTVYTEDSISTMNPKKTVRFVENNDRVFKNKEKDF